MDLTPYVESLRQDFASAASAGGDDARAMAERLVAPLESSVRLVLLDALSDAAAEITRDLAPGSVDVRLRGREPTFVVTPPPVEAAESDLHTGGGISSAIASAIEVTMGVRAPASDEADDGGSEGGTARVTLRLPEHLKAKVDDAAAQAGLSVNAWLVRAVALAVDPAAGPGRGPGAGSRHANPLGRSYRGWAR